jgi:hypothetical protein
LLEHGFLRVKCESCHAEKLAEYHVQREPDGQVQHDADDGRGDRRKGRAQRPVALQPLVGSLRRVCGTPWTLMERSMVEAASSCQRAKTACYVVACTTPADTPEGLRASQTHLAAKALTRC